MTRLSKLSPAALSAAMRGGTDGWDQVASVERNIMYLDGLVPNMRRRKCHCGCGKRNTTGAYANGIIMSAGCELSMRRWVKQMTQKRDAR